MEYEELSVTKRMRVGGTIESGQKSTLFVSGTLYVGNEVTFQGPLTAIEQVYIGTDKQRADLHVKGDLQVAGCVGIGTDDKRADLHVKGDGDLDGDLQVADHVGIGTAPDRDYLLKVDGDTSLGAALTVDGYVRIGNESPHHPLVVGPTKDELLLLTNEGDLHVGRFILGNTPLDKPLRGLESASQRAKELLSDKPDGTFMVGGPTADYRNHIFFYWKAGGQYYRAWIGWWEGKPSSHSESIE